MDIDSRMKSIPKYIGFLVKPKIPEFTSEEAWSGFNGLIVVWCFLNDLTAIIKIIKPKNKNIKLTLLLKL